MSSILRSVCEYTGLHAVMILGGPIPQFGGEIRTVTWVYMELLHTGLLLTVRYLQGIIWTQSGPFPLPLLPLVEGAIQPRRSGFHEGVPSDRVQ
jgi:hypothetical protein